MPAAAAADADAGDSGPPVEEIAPKIFQQNMKWILALALGILALGFILLYRAQPAAAVGSRDPGSSPGGEAVKKKSERGRR
jgi:hypothetical protein